jgi:bifunctional DNA-binding transcriptional regulator/antitoxin component of YhaV-PrlF toxin-antitoxin module
MGTVLLGTAKVSGQRQIHIPKAVQPFLNAKVGDLIQFTFENGKVTVQNRSGKIPKH